MDISINAKKADITLDTEKTLGDVLSGLEQWIAPSGNRIKEINVNGKALGDEALTEAFGEDIRGIKKLEIIISSWRELAAEALSGLLAVCTLYGNAAFDERKAIISGWESSPASRFLKTDIPDIHKLADLTFSGEGLMARDLGIIIEERFMEAANPDQEITGSEPLIKKIASRMEELPLDIQTGKDQQAAETIQLFSQVGEKLFRILFIYKSEGLSMDSFSIGDIPAKTFLDEFNSVLTELSTAYDNKDTVLVGDLAEYELSPRLLKFYNALKDFSASKVPNGSGG